MVTEVNPLGVNGSEYHGIKRRRVDWREKGLRVTRLRLLSDPGYPFWDVSYCYGEIRHADGSVEPVRVNLGFRELPRRRWKTAIVDAAKRDGVHAKRLGIFDAISSLI